MLRADGGASGFKRASMAALLGAAATAQVAPAQAGGAAALRALPDAVYARTIGDRGTHA